MKKIFSYNADIEKNAYLNWRTQYYNHIHNMFVIAEGFSDAALLLIDAVLTDNRDKKADNIIFPILFNSNHGIEVYLKAICWTQNQLLNTNNTFKENHNLRELLKEVIKLEELNKDSSDDIMIFYEMLADLNSYIEELYEKIERTTIKKGNEKKFFDISFCRYPLTNQTLEPQFYINTFDNVVIDLENFLKIFKGIFKNLRALSMHYSAKLEAKQEAEYELRKMNEEMQAEFQNDY
ncbi:MAG: hypothetical protein ABS948_16540 [Solibacillus sp.]